MADDDARNPGAPKLVELDDSEREKLVAAVQADFEAGLLTVRQVCERHGVVRSTLYRWAAGTDTSPPWRRASLRSEVRDRTLAKQVERSAGADSVTGVSPLDAYADLAAAIGAGHKAEIEKARTALGNMLNRFAGWDKRVDQWFGRGSSFSEMERDEQAKALKTLAAVMGGQAQVLARIVGPLERLLTLERRVWSLDSADSGSDGSQSWDEALQELESDG